MPRRAARASDSALRVEHRGAAEFAHHDDERVVEQASFFEVVDQAGHRQVQRRDRKLDEPAWHTFRYGIFRKRCETTHEQELYGAADAGELPTDGELTSSQQWDDGPMLHGHSAKTGFESSLPDSILESVHGEVSNPGVFVDSTD